MLNKYFKNIISINSKWQGAIWKILASICFAIIGGFAKALSQGNFNQIQPLSIYQIIFIENLIALLAIIIIQAHLFLKIFKTQLFKLQITRVFFASSGIIVWYTSLYLLPISQAIALSFIGPIITVISAYLFLEEPLSNQRIFAISLSILGSFIIIRPDLIITNKNNLISYFGILPLFPIVANILFSAAKITSRKLALKGATATSMTTYIFIGLVPISLIPAIISWKTIVIQHIFYLFTMGVLAFISHLMIAYSYKYANINFLTPFGFIRLITGTAIGWIAFDENLNINFWVGSSLIAISVIILILEYKNKKT